LPLLKLITVPSWMPRALSTLVKNTVLFAGNAVRLKVAVIELLAASGGGAATDSVWVTVAAAA